MMCVCIPDRENPPCSAPRQLSVLPRQWPSAWCHVPTACQLILGRRSQPDPNQPPFPFKPALKPLFEIESLIILYDHSWPHTQRQTERRSNAVRNGTRKRGDILSPTRLFPNIAFPRPTHPLVFVMVAFFLIKDVDMRSSGGWEPHSVETFVCLFEE